MKKYEIVTRGSGHRGVLHALQDIYNNGELICKAGDNGAMIDNPSEQVLSQSGDCWADESSYIKIEGSITDNAFVSNSVLDGKIFVRDNAKVLDSRLDNRSAIGDQLDTIIICDHTYLNNINILLSHNANGNGTIILSGYTNISNNSTYAYRRQFDIEIEGSPNVMLTNVTFIKPDSESCIKIHIEHDVQLLGSTLPNLDDPQIYNEFVSSKRMIIGDEYMIRRGIELKQIDVDYNYILYNPGVQNKKSLLFPLDYIK